jgi:epoxyqueuosine reductase
VKRIGRDRFVRNVLIAAGNSGLPDLVPACAALLTDVSADVRGMAVWALSRLLAGEEYMRLRAEHLKQETDEQVRQEWMTES